MSYEDEIEDEVDVEQEEEELEDRGFHRLEEDSEAEVEEFFRDDDRNIVTGGDDELAVDSELEVGGEPETSDRQVDEDEAGSDERSDPGPEAPANRKQPSKVSRRTSVQPRSDRARVTRKKTKKQIVERRARLRQLLIHGIITADGQRS